MNYNPPEEYKRGTERHEKELKVSCAEQLIRHREKLEAEKREKSKTKKR